MIDRLNKEFYKVNNFPKDSISRDIAGYFIYKFENKYYLIELVRLIRTLPKKRCMWFKYGVYDVENKCHISMKNIENGDYLGMLKHIPSLQEYVLSGTELEDFIDKLKDYDKTEIEKYDEVLEDLIEKGELPPLNTVKYLSYLTEFNKCYNKYFKELVDYFEDRVRFYSVQNRKW